LVDATMICSFGTQRCTGGVIPRRPARITSQSQAHRSDFGSMGTQPGRGEFLWYGLASSTGCAPLPLPRKAAGAGPADHRAAVAPDSRTPPRLFSVRLPVGLVGELGGEWSTSVISRLAGWARARPPALRPPRVPPPALRQPRVPPPALRQLRVPAVPSAWGRGRDGDQPASEVAEQRDEEPDGDSRSRRTGPARSRQRPSESSRPRADPGPRVSSPPRTPEPRPTRGGKCLHQYPYLEHAQLRKPLTETVCQFGNSGTSTASEATYSCGFSGKYSLCRRRLAGWDRRLSMSRFIT
jgi:hypothetical protein